MSPTTHLEPEQSAQRATQAEIESRLALVSSWLLEGKPRAEVQQAIVSTMFVSQRTAQQYVQEAQRRLAGDAAAEEQLYYLRLSQHQRDQLLANVLGYTQMVTQVDPKVLRAFTDLVKTASKLLDGRNATAVQIQKLIAESGNLLRDGVRSCSSSECKTENDARPAAINAPIEPSSSGKQSASPCANDAHPMPAELRELRRASRTHPRPTDQTRNLVRHFIEGQRPQVLPSVAQSQRKSKPMQDLESTLPEQPAGT